MLSIALVSLTIAACADDPPAGPPPEPGPELLDRITAPVDGGSAHLVRLVQRGDQYAFDPAEIVIGPGDVIRFVMVGSQPESVAFDPVTATPEAAAYIRQNALQLGVLLTDAGQSYDVSFRDAPPGRYPFLSLPHAGHGMRGVVEVVE
jgi:plastocyanin